MEKPLPSTKGKFLHLFSPRRLGMEIALAWAMYPITIVFIGISALYAILLTWDAINPSAVVGEASAVSLALGSLFSLAVYQWGRCLQAGSRLVTMQVVVVIFSALNFVALIALNKPLTGVAYIGYGAAYTALCVAIVFLPALRGLGISRQWRYTMGVLGAAATGFVIMLVLAIAVMIVITTLILLFNINEYRLYITLEILFALVLPSMVFIRRLPNPAVVEAGGEAFGRTVAAFCKNVLLPLVLIYGAILYVYAAKILLIWELPKGMVSWMVTGLVCAVLVAMYGLQGYLCLSDSKVSAKRIASFAMRWLPLVVVPLLVLMSVAILYRIGQYGITPSRLYVLTFNIWAYCAVIYLYIAKVPRLNMVASSFALVFLITSVIPGLNYSTIGIRAIQSKIILELREAGAEHFPLKYTELEQLLRQMPNDRAESVADDLDYLDDWTNHSNVAPIVTHSSRIYKWELITEVINVVAGRSVDLKTVPLSPVPEGFSSLEYKERSLPTARVDGKYSMTIDSVKFVVPVDSMVRLDEADALVPVWTEAAQPANASYVITGFVAEWNDADTLRYSRIKVTGYLLKK